MRGSGCVVFGPWAGTEVLSDILDRVVVAVSSWS